MQQRQRSPQSNRVCGRTRTLARLTALAVGAFLVLAGPAGFAKEPANDQIMLTYSTLPLQFERNQGQTDRRVTFLSRGPGYTLFLTPSELVLALSHVAATPTAASANPQQALLRLQFLGANLSQPLTGRDELPGKANYFVGADPTAWHTNIPTYTQVAQQAIYPGVDVVYYGHQRQLEFDFVVAPGADPNVIRLHLEGPDRLEVEAQGDLVLHFASGDLRLPTPVVYQTVQGTRHVIPGGYVLTDAQEVRFQVAAYDTTRPLVIDPTLVYSTYLGGTGGDFGHGIAVDASGNAYVAGYTSSLNFPVTAGAFSTVNPTAFVDTFVTKLNPTGSALVYSTYLGGSNHDSCVGQGNGSAQCIAVDTAGNAYVTGGTLSSDFPTTAGAFQTALVGGGDAFVTKLNPTGSALVYSTYLGGSLSDFGTGIAVDSFGNAYVIGDTQSCSPGSICTTNFPTTTGAFQTAISGSTNAFVTKLNPTGSALVYSTYLGVGLENASGIAIDTAGNAYVTGDTSNIGSQFPTTAGAFQTGNPAGLGYSAAFVTKLNPTGSALVYSTFLGGRFFNYGNAIAMDTAGNAYVTGLTTSLDFPTTVGAVQPAIAGVNNAFVTKLNPTGSALVYSTYLGGSTADTGQGIAVDSSGNAYVTGLTNSLDFPTTAGAVQTAFGGAQDAFMTKVNATGSGLVYSTYLGGSGTDFGNAIAVDASGNAYVTGATVSANFPVTAGAFQTAFAGTGTGTGPGYNAFVAKLGEANTNAPPVCTAAQPSVRSLWAPNSQMVSVSITGITDPTNDPITLTYPLVTQDEPIRGLFATDLSPDAAVSGQQILLRAERSPKGDGRVYEVHVTATDNHGGRCSAAVQVRVPHSLKDTAVNSGQTYNSFGP